MFKKLIATAVSLVLCLATLCACRSYDEFYFDELVFLDVWIGIAASREKTILSESS